MCCFLNDFYCLFRNGCVPFVLENQLSYSHMFTSAKSRSTEALLAKLSALEKLFKRIVTQQLAFATKSSFSLFQYGFLKINRYEAYRVYLSCFQGLL